MMSRTAIGLSLLAICLMGCVAAIPETDFDSAMAREVLDSALTAWKDGKAKSLAKRTPPIRFVDEDWRAGYRLVKFDVVAPEEPIEPWKGTRVQLTLIDRNGKTIERPADYQVSLSPNLAVLRSDP